MKSYVYHEGFLAFSFRMLGNTCSNVHDHWFINLITKDNVYLLVNINPAALCQPEGKQLAIIELVHKEYRLMKFPHVLVIAVHYCINRKSSYRRQVLTWLVLKK